jgi:hypothetical protein
MASTSNEEKERTQLVRQFGEDWELRTATREIIRKNTAWYLDIWPRQHQVRIMYLWMKVNWSQYSNQNLPFPVDHDNVPKTPGQPVLYALLGGWTIPKKDLDYLTGGPLYSESWELLIPEKRKVWKNIIFRAKKSILWILITSVILLGSYLLLNNHS